MNTDLLCFEIQAKSWTEDKYETMGGSIVFRVNSCGKFYIEAPSFQSAADTISDVPFSSIRALGYVYRHKETADLARTLLPARARVYVL